MRVKILVPSYNCRDYIHRCLGSIAAQTYPNLDVLVVDDASTDGTDQISRRWCEQLGWDWHRNEQNQKCPRNLWEFIPALEADPDDAILLVDGDDFLLHPGAVTFLADEFRDPDLWLTYGQFELWPADVALETPIAYASPYSTKIVRDRAFRDRKRAPYNQFDHPLCFRQHLWEAAVEEDDLKQDDGAWFTGGYDATIMIPMLEAAGGDPPHFRCLQERLYGYNAENPLNEVKVQREVTARTMELYSRSPKPRHVR